MEIPNCFYRLSIKALVFDETHTKFLIVQEENGKWELPGGGLDWGELPAEGLRREIKEEMGLEVKSIATQPAYLLTKESTRKSCWIINAVYETELVSLDFTPSNECLTIQFVTKEQALIHYPGTNIEALAQLLDPKNHN